MNVLYSILFKNEFVSINNKIEETYEMVSDACFGKEIWLLVVAALIALA